MRPEETDKKSEKNFQKTLDKMKKEWYNPNIIFKGYDEDA